MKKAIFALLFPVLVAQAGKTEEDVVQALENGRFADAQAAVKKALPRGEELVRLEAFLYHGAAMADSAEVYLRRALEITPNDPRISLRLAEALIWKKDLVHARALVDAVSVREAQREPRPWENATRRAMVYLYLQDLPQAQEGFQSIVSDPRTPGNWAMAMRVYLAQIAAWRKEFSRAIAMSDTVLKGDPGHVQASLIKGQVQEWQARYPEARATYTLALQKHPDDWQLRQRLEKLSWVK